MKVTDIAKNILQASVKSVFLQKFFKKNETVKNHKINN